MRKRLDVEMPVGRKRRRAFWLFFLLLPLLLWWWIGRGPTAQAPSIVQAPSNAQAPPAGTPRRPVSATPVNRTSDRPVNRTSDRPVTGVSKTPAATRHTSRSPSEAPPATAAAIPPVAPNTASEDLSRGLQRRLPRGIPPGLPSSQGSGHPYPNSRIREIAAGSDLYAPHRPTAERNASKPGLTREQGTKAHLTRSEIDVRLASTGTRKGIDVPGPEIGKIRQQAPGDKKPGKPAKPAATVNPAATAKSAAPAKVSSARPPKQEDTRILFAAGMAVNKSFPVGAQQEVDYNANLKKDIWFDYLPTPYFQYHPGRRVALQTGLQFNSPQYTENVSIFRKAGPPIGIGGQFTQDTVLVVKKLYYFNFPLIAYYSPVRNLYLGAGMQFSSLRNGVALQNNVLHYIGSGGGQRDTVQFSKFVVLKDNAAAYGNLKKEEWRGLLELNYYWHKITLAIQYQQSLDDYLHTPVPGSQGRDRNSSFNLYLRYNIWEKRVAVPPRR
jgi:hypothetical protein